MCVYLDDDGIYWYVKQIAMHEHWILEMLYIVALYKRYIFFCVWLVRGNQSTTRSQVQYLS